MLFNFNTTENINEYEPTIVAIIDSHVNMDQEYLKGRCIQGESFILDEDNKNKENHGTYVAGAAIKYADMTSRLFFQKKSSIMILPVEINVEDTQTDSGFLLGEAIQYAVDSGADVINMSFL